jgi:multidrug efflux system membrane fusion protein
MSKAKVIGVLALLLALCGVVLAFRSSRPSTSAKSGRNVAPPTVPVTAASAERRDVPVYLKGLGSVQAFYTVTIKSRVDGQIQQVAFREGQDVKKGELLVVIDPRPFQVALSQAQATLYRDQSQLTIQQRNFERYSGLFQQGIVSRQDFDAQQATLGQLEGTVRADQAQIDNAKLQLSYCRITSPIGGRAGLRMVDPGNMVHAADTNGLVVITELRPIAVLFTLPEDDVITVLRRAQGGTLPAEAYSRDDSTKIASGKLETVNNQIDPTTGTDKLKAVFDNTDGLLWPNQFVNVHLLLDVKKDAVTIPVAAVQRGNQGTFVYVVKPDKSVEARPIQTGVTEGDIAQIQSGLQAGELVVTDGQDKLQKDSKVEVRPASGPSHPARTPTGAAPIASSGAGSAPTQ